MHLARLQLRSLLSLEALRLSGLNLAIRGLDVAWSISTFLDREKAKDCEVWLCFSSISYILAFCHLNELLDSSSSKNSRHINLLVLSRAPLVPKVEETLHRKSKCRVIRFLPDGIASNLLLLWILTGKILRGHNIKLNLPHLSEFVVGPLILKLAQYNRISLGFYDDGLLGCLNNPTVLSFYPKKISNICRWDVTFWKAPVGISVLKQTIIPLKQLASYAENEIMSTTHSSSDLIVIEAKYMAYDLLNKIFSQSCQYQDTLMVTYFQHPAFHKRNCTWPATALKRAFISEQCETWLFRNISNRSHIYSAVTSSVILACECALQGLISSFKLTLLINSHKSHVGLESLYDRLEALDFEEYITSSYSDVVDLEIIKSNYPDGCCSVNQ